MARACFVHIGTHKTGTTALQRFFARNDGVLRRDGSLYPLAGRYRADLPGHHNIAFELAGDERYDPALGTLADLCRELEAAPDERVYISSEGFGFLHDRDDRMHMLQGALAGAGFCPKAVVYLRPQADYLEALYGTLIRHGYARSFSQCLSEALDSGVVRASAVRSYQCEYDVLLTRATRIFGAPNIVVRAYRTMDEKSWLIDDFFAATGHSRGAGYAEPGFHNVRRAGSQIARELVANVGRGISSTVAHRLAHLETAEARPGVDAAFRALTADDRERIGRRFAPGNERVRHAWGIAIDAAGRSREPSDLADAAAEPLAVHAMNEILDAAAAQGAVCGDANVSCLVSTPPDSCT
uniref:Sulfotransferase domain-containing protein n=1 Tax=uncultured organism TaxID=155900 RepID=A0A7L9QC28_9ZZZZ|nr:hypothetical protein [uncultured organism]